jgi:predicted membrane-bound spermidine synthase
VSTILTGFFGGMAIGSAVGGRVADRVPRPLRLYGALELVLVFVVLVTPLTFRLLHEVYRGAFGTLETAPLALALVRFVLALGALGPATILMGATLPTLTRYLSRGAGDLSTAFGRLYAANTIGAIFGTIAAGFILIELLGLTGTLVVGATCSATAGCIALAIDRMRSGHDTPAPPEMASVVVDERGAVAAQTIRPRLRLALSVAFVSGLTSLSYQVLWTRLLASGTGNSTYVFTTILAVFLSGLALGALAFTRARPRIHDPVSLLAHGQIAIGVLAAVGLVFGIDRHLTGLLPLLDDFSTLFTAFIGPVITIVLPATFVMGLTFPASSALVAESDGKVATNAGSLLAANTAGAIVGTFVVPFLLIVAIGSPASVAVIALLNLATGIALALNGGMRKRLPRIVVSVAGALVAGSIVLALIDGMVFVDPNVGLIQSGGGTILASSEDEIASVQAGEVDGHRLLWVTGTSMTLQTVDVKLMPIIPLIFRPDSTSALTIAFGMGSAYRAALIAGLRTDAVELVPSVPEMFGYFYPDAAQVLANPNGHLTISDGRNYVELTDKTYDIIVVDPPPPIETAGVSVISSREFYSASKARLTPGGVMMQWVPQGETLDEFKAHVRTFRDVFANVIVARGPGGFGYYMFGSDHPMRFSDANTRAVLARPGVLADLSSAFDSPHDDLGGWVNLLPRLVLLTGDQVSEFAGPGPLVTDDQPLPEYFLLRHLFGSPSPRVSSDQIVP